MLITLLLLLGEINADEKIKELDSADRSVRIAAVRALLESKTVPKEAVEPLIEMIRRELVEALQSPPIAGKPEPIKKIPIKGDEVSLARIKANPKQYVGKEFYLVGDASIEDYFNYAYSDLGEQFYCIELRPLKADGNPDGDEWCYLYISRGIGAGLAERLTQAAEKDARGLLRVRATINPRRYSGVDGWNMFEVDDWHYYDRAKADWQPSVFEGAMPCCDLLTKIGKPAIPKLIAVIGDKPSEPAVVDALCRQLAVKALERMDKACLKTTHAQLRTLQRKQEKRDVNHSFKHVNDALLRVEKAEHQAGAR
jgi:hypothetical protein